MMPRKEIIWNLLIILFVFILAMIPWSSVFGIQDPGLLEAAGMMQRGAAAIIIASSSFQVGKLNSSCPHLR